MKRKFLNILVIFFIVFISIFASKKVEASAAGDMADAADAIQKQLAKETPQCSYVLPFTAININKSSLRNMVINLDNHLKISQRGIVEFQYNCFSKPGECYFRYNYFDSQKEFKNDENSQKIDVAIPEKYYSYYFFIGENHKFSKCSDYVTLSYDASKSYKTPDLALSSFVSSSFLNGDNAKKKYVSTLSNQYGSGTSNIYMPVADVNQKDEQNQIVAYIKQMGQITLINTNLSEKYQGDYYSKFIDEVKKNNNNVDEIISSFPVDKENNNTRSITKDYYNLTYSSWDKVLKNNSDTGYYAKPIVHQTMANWFYYSGRDLLDNNPQLFEKIYKIIFKGFIDEKLYNAHIKAIESIQDYNDAADKEDCFDNPCNVYCTTQSKNGTGVSCDGTAWNECTKYDSVSKKYTGSQDYGRCQTAYKECESKAENDCSRYPTNSTAYEECIGDESSKQNRIDSCLKEKLGVEEYNKMKEKEKTQKEAIEQEKEDAINKFIHTLSSVTAPSLDINFDKHYELTCDDVSFFHGFYVVIRILAPIAVVLFGTLDYAKAVLSADIDKLNKSKKSLPKRILLLILFLGVPFIVSFMVNLFGGDFSLMKCIINGE